MGARSSPVYPCVISSATYPHTVVAAHVGFPPGRYPIVTREVYLAVISDAHFVVVSIAFIFLFTAAVLRLPLLACLSILVVLAAFPVAYAVRRLALERKELSFREVR
jgi:hypothetical protein